MDQNTHQDLFATFSTARTGVANSNIDVIRDIADALYAVPPVIDQTFAETCLRAASYLNNTSFLTKDSSFDLSKNLVSNDESKSEVFRNAVLESRNKVFDVVNQCDALVSKLSVDSQNFTSPFATISLLNSTRKGFQPLSIDENKAIDLINNIGFFLELIEQQQDENERNSSSENAAQLSSIDMSFEGFGGSGNAALDMMQFMPDSELISDQKAKDSLALKNFSLNVPKILFTADYSPDGILRGAIVVWRKIPDASGYLIKRRNIFDGEEVTFSVTNDEAKTGYDVIKDYVKTWGLTFYDSVSDDSVFARVDETIFPNSFYIYTIQAYQAASQLSGAIFLVDVIPNNLGTAQRLELQNRLSNIDGKSFESVNPYPFLAQQLLGNSMYDWILAGVNIRHSIDTLDNKDVSLRYSYLPAKLSFIFEQMDAGKFVIPRNVNDVVSNVNLFIGQFGVGQTIQEIFQSIGILYTFDGVEPQENQYFNRLGLRDIADGGVMSVVTSAIDPETYTLDLSTLSTNFPKLLNGILVGETELRDTPKTQNISTEIEISQFESFRAAPNISGDQFLQKFSGFGSNVFDLTLFDGISKLTRSVKFLYDLGYRKAAAIPVAPREVVEAPKSYTGFRTPNSGRILANLDPETGIVTNFIKADGSTTTGQVNRFNGEVSDLKTGEIIGWADTYIQDIQGNMRYY